MAQEMIGIRHTGTPRAGIGLPGWGCDGTPRPEMVRRYGKHMTLHAGESVAVDGAWLAYAMERYPVFASYFDDGRLEIMPAGAVGLDSPRTLTVSNTSSRPVRVLGGIPESGSVTVSTYEVVRLIGTPARRLFEDGTLVVEGFPGGWQALEKGSGAQVDLEAAP